MKQSCLTILIFFLSNVFLLSQESIKVMTFNLNGVVERGNYSVVWNGLDKNGHLAATGVYFFEMKMKGYSQTKVGLLLK